ncbi:MAG: DUF5916 domain-containing protein [Bacteroidota bacterium]
MRQSIRWCALLLLLGAGGVPSLYGQKINAEYQIRITRAVDPIVIDGRMEERTWQEADLATDFFQVSPMDTSGAINPSDVRMAFDEEHLYILAVNYKSSDQPTVVQSLRRDFSFMPNDNFIVFMDPFDDQTNGFAFGANAAGAEWEGMMYDGGSVNLNWENRWVSQVRELPDRWIFEAAIPFKSIRYDADQLRWGINFSRRDVRTSERSSWAPVPRQFPTASLAYTGVLVWEEPPPEPGSNVSVIPYTLAGGSRSYGAAGESENRLEAGADVKVGVTSSMNLDLTINPDFSQVEVDRQVTDLDRYELFFPEKRQFFLENADLFSDIGTSTLRPFFSRRVGLDSPIQFGARLSGQLNRDWRIGVMNMQTGSRASTDSPAENFSVVTLRRRIASRSNVGIFLVNQQRFDADRYQDFQGDPLDEYGRNVGAEFNLASSNNVWTGHVMAMNSFHPGGNGQNLAHSANLEYSDGNWSGEWEHEYVGRDVQADAGYIPRLGYIQTGPRLGYLFYPSGGPILSHGPEVSHEQYLDSSFRSTDYEQEIGYRGTFRRGDTVRGWYGISSVELLDPFDPTGGVSGFLLPIGSEHRWRYTGLQLTSASQQTVTYEISGQVGGYYAEGKRWNGSASMGYRFQPYLNLELYGSYNRLDLPNPWGETDFWLAGSRVDLTFTKNLYFTTFTQYNQQIERVNLNTRLQWRLAPASDLFVVYTDNYDPAGWGPQSRALVVKLSYWWNP